MLVHRPVHVELEMTKWLIVLAIATAFVLGLIVSTAGADDSGIEPKLLPPDMQVAAKPMTSAEIESPKLLPPPKVTGHEENLAVWQAMQNLELRRPAKATVQEWSNLPMSPDAESWRQMVIGVTHMKAGEYREAAAALLAAEAADPDNPVVHYNLAKLRLRQAGASSEWTSKKGVFRLAVLTTTDGKPANLDTSVAPNTKSMYEYVAMMELRRALKRADSLDMNQRMLDTQWTTPAADELVNSMPMETARVADLLEALDMSRYEAHAHYLLGRLYLRHGMPDQALPHLEKGESFNDFDAAANTLPSVRVVSF